MRYVRRFWPIYRMTVRCFGSIWYVIRNKTDQKITSFLGAPDCQLELRLLIFTNFSVFLWLRSKKRNLVYNQLYQNPFSYVTHPPKILQSKQGIQYRVKSAKMSSCTQKHPWKVANSSNNDMLPFDINFRRWNIRMSYWG